MAAAAGPVPDWHDGQALAGAVHALVGREEVLGQVRENPGPLLVALRVLGLDRGELGFQLGRAPGILSPDFGELVLLGLEALGAVLDLLHQGQDAVLGLGVLGFVGADLG